MHFTYGTFAAIMLLTAVAAAHARNVGEPTSATGEKRKPEPKASSRTQGATQPELSDNKDYRHSWIDVDGVKTHYIEAGEGDTFVLVHGALPWSSGGANYGDVMGPIGKHFHAVALDMVGYGYTAPRGPKDYSGQAQGEFLIRFIDALDVGPVFLTGNSHGGFLVQYVTHERPDLARKLVLTNSLSGTSGDSRFRWSSGPGAGRPVDPLQSQTVEQIRSMLERYYQHKDLVTEERVRLVHDIYQRNYENFQKRNDAISESTKENYNETLSYKGRHISEWGGDLEVPVLLVWSDQARALSGACLISLGSPGAEMHLLPWSGHHHLHGSEG